MEVCAKHPDLFVPVVQPTFEVVDEFAPSARASGGFGHSGRM